MTTTVLSLCDPPSIEPVELGALWRRQRDRLAEALAELEPVEWAAPSRCRSWSVADVVAHLADGARRMISTLEVDGSGHATFRDVDPRITPAEWILGGDRAPQFLLEDYRRSTDDLFGLVRELHAGGCRLRVWAPYRHQIPWQLFVLHGLFDHWLHERDVLLPLGRAHHPTATEIAAVGAYSLLVASVVAAFHRAPADAHVHLTGRGGGCARFSGHRGEVQLSAPARCDGADDGCAEAVTLPDALTGRTTSVAATLHGAPALVDSLGLLADWFRDGP